MVYLEEELSDFFLLPPTSPKLRPFLKMLPSLLKPSQSSEKESPCANGLVRWSPACDHLGIGYHGRKERVCILDASDPSNMKEMVTLCAGGRIHDFQFSESGSRVVVAGGTVWKTAFEVFDAQTGRLLHKLGIPLLNPSTIGRECPLAPGMGHPYVHPPTMVRFVAPDIVAVSSRRWTTVRFYDMRYENKEVDRLCCLDGNVRFIDANKKTIVIQSGDDGFHQFEAVAAEKTGGERSRFLYREETLWTHEMIDRVGVTGVAVAPDGVATFCGHAGGRNIKPGHEPCLSSTPISDMVYHGYYVEDSSFHPLDPLVLAMCGSAYEGENGNTLGPVDVVRVGAFEANSHSKDRLLAQAPDLGPVVSVAFNRDGTKLAYTTRLDGEGRSVVCIDSFTKKAAGHIGGDDEQNGDGDEEDDDDQWELKRFPGAEIEIKHGGLQPLCRRQSVKVCTKIRSLWPKRKDRETKKEKTATEKEAALAEWEQKSFCSETTTESGGSDGGNEVEELSEKKIS